MTEPRLLLIDDEPNVLETMSAIFQMDGFDVATAANDLEIREALSREHYDVVVTDLRLGDTDGMSIIDRLREEHPGTAAIVLTGYASLESAVEAMHRGAHDYFLKPCNVDELKAAVRRALAHRELTRDLRQRVADIERSAGAKARTGMREVLSDVVALTDEVERARRELELALARERASGARLRELDDLKNRFLSNVTHELRTPLTAIAGYVGLLQKRTDGGDVRITSAVGAIAHATDQLKRLIDDVLDLSAVETGALRMKRSSVDLHEAIDDVTALLQPLVEEKELRLTTTVAGDLSVDADPLRIGQVLNNLISNAVSYTQPGGSIAIEAYRGAGFAHVVVNDTGPGMTPDELRLVFSRFYRGSKAVEVRPKGLGLGLAISRAIVDAHGGTMWLESELDHGTSVHFTLPLVPVEAAVS